ncbi:LysR family transcriptional regulator [Sulfitobacter sp. LCG007]
MQQLKPVRVFLEVADRRSFAAAARKLQMSPASVTRIVASLEEELGQQLLVRTTRQVSLTSSGAAVAARYRPLIEEFDRVTEDIALRSRPDRGRLTINAPLSLGQRLLPALIGSFRLAYPNIRLEVRLTDTLVDILRDGSDLAIRVSGPPADKSTIWRKVREVPLYAVASPQLFERIPRPEAPDDLDRAHCLSYAEDAGPEIWRFRKGPLTRSIRAGLDVVSNNGDFLYGLAESGNGIAMLPCFMVSDGLKSGAVERVLPDWDLPSLWLTLFYPPYDELPPLVATFSDFFESYIRDARLFDVPA